MYIFWLVSFVREFLRSYKNMASRNMHVVMLTRDLNVYQIFRSGAVSRSCCNPMIIKSVRCVKLGDLLLLVHEL